jgi:hypothetical protein
MNAESRFVDGFTDRLVSGTGCESYTILSQVVTTAVNRQTVKHQDITAFERVPDPFRVIFDQLP